MSESLTYRGWDVYQSYSPIARYVATAPDYDVDYNDEDGFVSSGGHVFSDSLDDLKAQIDEYIEEQSQ